MTPNAPIIGYNNLLSTATVSVLRGLLDSSSSLDRLYDSDLLRPAFFNSAISGLVIGTAAAAWRSVRLSDGLSYGKWYWESVASGASVCIGVGNASAALAGYPGGDANGWGYADDGQKYTAGAGAAYGATFTTGDIIGALLDMDAGTLTFYKNGVSQGVAYSGLSGPLYPMFGVGAIASHLTLVAMADELTHTPAGIAAIGEISAYSSHADSTVTENRVLEIAVYPTSAFDFVILGAARNDSAGQLSGATGLKITAYGSTVGFGAGGFGAGGFGGYNPINTSTFSLTSANKSRLMRFNTTCSMLVLKFTGCSTKVSIPEVFIGTALEMPFISYGFDPYTEVGNVSLFTAESGREYARLRYRRIEVDPKWNHIPPALWSAIDAFREAAVESRTPFWFAWRPDSLPEEVYLVRHAGNSAPFPYKNNASRNFGLKLQEVI